MSRYGSLLTRFASVAGRVSRKAARSGYAALPGKQALFEHLRGRLPKELFQHLHFHGDVSIPIGPRSSISMRHHGHSLENRLFWSGIDVGWEPTTLAIWRTLAPHARGILDVGANTGLFALVAAQLAPKARVVAVEPVARIFEKLVANVALNDMDIVSVCEAISDTVGVGTFIDPGTEHLYSVTIDHESSVTSAPPAHGRRRTVALSTIDALVERLALEHVDLVKLDVESHEPAALRGARNTLEKLRPTLLVEIWNDNVGEEVDRLLRPAGYDAFTVKEQERRLVPASTTRTLVTCNFLFVPQEQRELTVARLRGEAPIQLTVAD